MGSKSQRRKQQQARKRQEKRKQQVQSRAREQAFQSRNEVVLGSNARHRQRMARQVPRAWPGEAPQDIAIFDDSVFSTLAPETAQQVLAVREAIRDVSQFGSQDALDRLASISRSSPLSDWRLFVRGLVDWLRGDTEAASEAWRRLDPERRPGRIATAMMVSLRSDLEQVSHPPGNGEPAGSPPSSTWDRWDDQLLYHAKLLRRVRFDRAALRIAEIGLNVPEESSKLQVGPKKIQWLRQFIAEFGDTEPELAAALSRTALARACTQEYSDLFEQAARSFQGPRHDPHNRLLTFFYFRRFTNDPSAEQSAERAFRDYLQQDLPRNESLSAPLRSAIASQIHLLEALPMIRTDRGGGILGRMFEPPEDPQAIRAHLRAAVKACPANRAAHKTYSDWIESQLDNERLTVSQQTKLEEELSNVMVGWSQGLPDDVGPRLWLVDYLLENERTEEAKPHVDFLAGSRQDDPRVRATPWKWQLLEASRRCRRKAWLSQVPAHLDAAESLWPAWLSRQWLPYLKAAWTLRTEGIEAFESERQRICQESGVARDSLVDACMMLGAAQRMRASADEVKRLRSPVDQALKDLDGIPHAELVAVGGFFWDLHRAQLVYPSYRMHGAKFGKELIDRWKKSPRLVLDDIQDERIHKALLWCSEYRFWPRGYQISLPSFYSDRAIQRHPMFAAAWLSAFLKQRYTWRADKYQELGALLREAAPSQRDVFYRYWFLKLANDLEDARADNASPSFGNPFGNLFEDFDDEDEDDEFDDLDDGLGFDPDCDCPDCQAAKRAHEKAQATRGATLF